MTADGDGFLSSADLRDLMESLGVAVEVGDVRVLHRFLGGEGEQELVAASDFFSAVRDPPAVAGGAFSGGATGAKATGPRARAAVVNIDLDRLRPSEMRYEHTATRTGGGDEVIDPALHESAAVRALGDLSCNPDRRRSQLAREGGWTGEVSTSRKAAGTFGNVFEHQAVATTNEHRRSSSFMFTAGDAAPNAAARQRQLPTCPREAAGVFKKIAAYMKAHGVLVEDVRVRVDVNKDGRLDQVELKKVSWLVGWLVGWFWWTNNLWFSLFSDCRIVGLSDCRIVGLSDCWIVGLLDCLFVVLFCSVLFLLF